MLKSNPAKNVKKAERFADTIELYCAMFFTAWAFKTHPSLVEEYHKALASGEVAKLVNDARRDYEENRSSK